MSAAHLPDRRVWVFSREPPLVTAKLPFLAGTLGLTLHAKLRLGAITPATLTTHAWHARAVTVLAVLLLAAGVGLRLL